MHEHSPPVPNLARIATGIRGVDTILGGGFTTGSVQLLIGKPGTGKTIFANQCAFHHASDNHTAAYVTLLAESHARMLTHLEGFSFFAPELVSRRILYMSGYDVLEQSGLDGLLELLTRTIREQGASLLVIDGLTTAKEFAQTTTAFKRFLLRLTTSTSLTSCTTLLVSSVDRLSAAQPEDNTVDGIIWLDKRTRGARVTRELVVEKMRGTSYALGIHALDIDHDGLHVYPRVESLPVEPFVPATGLPRLEFGIPGLDSMLGGGVLPTSTTAILGATGTGKTLIGMSFLTAGATRGEPGVYVGLRERPEQVVFQAESIGLRSADAVASGKLTLMWVPTTEVSIDGMVWALLDLVEQAGIKRVFIDGMEALRTMLVYPERRKRLYTALVTRLAARGATTMMAEVAPPTRPAEETLALMSPNNVLVLQEVAKKRRTERYLVAVKVQAHAHNLSPSRIHISSKGLSVDCRRISRSCRDKP